jgi:hypothetical protein
MLQGGRGREVEISTLYLHHRQLLLKRSNTGVGHIRADEIQRPERRHIRQVYKAGVGDLRAIETLPARSVGASIARISARVGLASHHFRMASLVTESHLGPIPKSGDRDRGIG